MKEKESKISEGVLLGYITLMGYIVAFIFQYSYLNYFNVSYHFINIELINIFTAIFFVGVFLIIIRGIFLTLESVGLIKDTNIGRERFKLVVSLLPIMPSLFYDTGLKNFVYIYTGIILLYILLELSFTFIKGWGVKTWKEKRLKLEEFWSNKKEENFTPVVTNNFFSKLFVFNNSHMINLFFSSGFICVIAFIAGNIFANEREFFYVLSSDSNKVVIDQYKDSLIVIEIDKEKVMQNNLEIINRESLYEKNITLKLEKIGPLKK